MAIYPYSFTLPPVNKQDIPSNGVPGEFLGISAGGVLDWLPVAGGGGGGDMLKADNLSGLADYAIARTNIGLGLTSSPEFANLTLTSPSLSSSAPVTISQTWGTTGTYTAFKVVATETLGAASASNLLELWSGSTPTLKLSVGKGGSIISKVGVITPAGTSNAAGLSLQLFFAGCGLGIDNNGSTQFLVNGSAKTRCGLGVVVASDQAIAWSSATHTGLGVASDTILVRDEAANTLALRNGAAAQTFRVYNTYSDGGVNYERGQFGWNANVLEIRADYAGTGSPRVIDFVVANSAKLRLTGGASLFYSGLSFATDNTYDIGASGANRPKNVYVANGLTTGSISPNSGTDLIFNGASTGAAWKITPSGHFHAFADNSYDIGASGANRPKNVYVAQTVRANAFQLNGLSHVYSTVNGNIGLYDNNLTAFNLLQFGGTTNLFPAIKRNAAGLQIRLADDSANATLEAGNLYASGNVGIGTTAPGAKLEIVESTSNVAGLVLRTTTVGSPRFEFIDGATTPNKWSFGCGAASAIDGKFFIYDARQLVHRFAIDTAGNVGIGTTAPGSTLTVAGTFHFGSNNGALIGGTSYGGHLGSTQHFGLRSTSAVSTTIYLQNNSSGDKNALVRILGSGSGADHGALDINTIESSPILFTTGLSNERMRITAAGNVGIGTTSPTSKLHVAGEAFLAVNGSNTAPSLRIGAGANINGWYSFGGVQLNAVANSLNSLAITTSGTVITNGYLALGLAADVVLERDAQDELALRRGALGQKFSVYGTYPGAAWERFTITAPTSGNVLLGTYKGTGGIARGLEFQTDGVTRMTLNAAGTAVIFPSGMALQRTDGGGVIFDFTYNGVQFANTDGLGVSWSTITGPASLKHVGVYGYTSEPGVVQVNSSVKGTLRDLRCRSVIEQPPASITPTLNGDLVVEATSNTTLTFKLKGTDGTVRTGTITLA